VGFFIGVIKRSELFIHCNSMINEFCLEVGTISKICPFYAL
jgi:hypothetical protein